jgi:RNA methyltransferase, TrmH family
MGPGYASDGTTPPATRDPSAAAVAAVAAARRDPGRVVLEGVHALKHAIRFGAAIEVIVSADVPAMERLLAEMAPDVVLPVRPVALTPGAWGGVVGRDLPSPALAVARRPATDAAAVLAAHGRIVVLEDPRHLGNLGAVVRVSAAAAAGGVLVVGAADPWHPTAVRAAAGLQFALPVARAGRLAETDRPVIALDAHGDAATTLPGDALLLVGTERGGLSKALRARADRTVAIPMRDGVSSLNLATAVAVALYTR